MRSARDSVRDLKKKRKKGKPFRRVLIGGSGLPWPSDCVRFGSLYGRPDQRRNVTDHSLYAGPVSLSLSLV